MRFTSVTHIGTKPVNKDSFEKICRDGVYCFVIADGEGPGGEEGASVFTKAFIEAFEFMPHVSEQAAKECFEVAQEQFMHKMDTEDIFSEMYASAAALILDGECYVCVHSGNARIYGFSKGMIEFCTNDHTKAMEKYKSGSLDSIRDDSEYAALTRKIGAGAEPQISGINVIKKNSAFLICTDGFWMNVTEGDMLHTLNGVKSSKEWLMSMLNIIESKSCSECGNITAAAILM